MKSRAKTVKTQENQFSLFLKFNFYILAWVKIVCKESGSFKFVIQIFPDYSHTSGYPELSPCHDLRGD
jgi:hypothetical protein